MARAVVVGGGTGGLAAAIGLRRRGWDVVVLERAQAFSPVGAGLTLMPNGLRALEALGVGAAVTDILRPYRATTFRRRDGRLLARVTAAAGDAGAGVHRSTLHRVLLERLPAEAVRTGAEVVAVDGGRQPVVTVRGSGGSTTALEADLLVGADGLRSTVRTALWPHLAAPRPVGATAWRGVTAGPRALHDAEVSWAPGTEVGLVPLEDGRVYWYVCVRTGRAGPPPPDGPPDGRRTADAADARNAVAGWYPEVTRTLDATDDLAVIRTELHHLRPGPERYASAGVALLGDAAHAMPPYVGQGANQALEDAVVLAALVGPGEDVPTSLLAYDRARRPRATAVARAARVAGRVGHQVTSRPVVAARDLALALAPDRSLRGIIRLTRWSPPPAPVDRP